jgi:hypothetical protein
MLVLVCLKLLKLQDKALVRNHIELSNAYGLKIRSNICER